MKNKPGIIIISLVFSFMLTQLLFGAENGKSETKSFSVKKGGLLKVNLQGGDIHLTAWDKAEVVVSTRESDEDEDEGITVKQSGNTITVRTDEESDWYNNMRLDISLPKEFDVELYTSQGNITIDGAMTGKLTGSTSGGDVRLGDVTGTVEMTTSGGDIRAGNIKGDLTVKTSGGDIAAGSVDGTADVNTSGGNIRIKDVTKTLWARTAGGDVEAGDIGGDLTVSTAGGNITVGKVATAASLSTAGGDIDLDGANGHVKAKTAGGNLQLYGITGSVDGKTSGGDVEVELTPKGTDPSRLQTAGGTVSFYIPENAKATIAATIRLQGGWRHAKNDYHIHSAFKADEYVTDPDEHEIRATYSLNGGGPRITLETVNADIEIGKLGSHIRKSSDE